MSNVIKLFENVGQDFGGEQLYFPVSLQEFDVQFMNGSNDYRVADARAFRAVVREDTQEVLAVHSKDYNLVTNEEIYPQFEDALMRSSIDMTDMYTDVQLNDGGASCVKSYHFPAHKITIAKGDEVDMRLQVVNSYDGRWAFGTLLGGYRLVCTNGMTIGQKFMSTYGRHTKNLNIQQSVQKLDKAVQIYLDHEEVWKHWAGKRCDRRQVRQILEVLEMPESFIDTIVAQFDIEVRSIGRNIWAFFNALTFWSTHHKRKANAQVSVTQLNREKRVREVINSRAFAKLAA